MNSNDHLKLIEGNQKLSDQKCYIKINRLNEEKLQRTASIAVIVSCSDSEPSGIIFDKVHDLFVIRSAGSC